MINIEEDQTKTIPIKEYELLLRDSRWLRCLNQAGVNNWEGNDYAHDLFAENYPEYAEI